MKFKDTLAALLRTNDKGKINAIIAQFQTTNRLQPRKQKARLKALAPPPDYGPLAAPHRHYLTKRGFDPDQLVKTWEIGACGPRGGSWSWRVIIPIHNSSGRLVAWQGRHIGTVEPKYRMLDDDLCLQDPKTLLYGIDKVEGDSVIVVEGVPSVWWLGEGAISTFGIDWKWEQFHGLRTFKRRFILFDSEPKAQDRAKKLAANLALFPGETEIIRGDWGQPTDIPKKEVISIRKELGFAIV